MLRYRYHSCWVHPCRGDTSWWLKWVVRQTWNISFVRYLRQSKLSYRENWWWSCGRFIWIWWSGVWRWRNLWRYRWWWWWYRFLIVRGWCCDLLFLFRRWFFCGRGVTTFLMKLIPWENLFFYVFSFSCLFLALFSRCCIMLENHLLRHIVSIGIWRWLEWWLWSLWRGRWWLSRWLCLIEACSIRLKLWDWNRIWPEHRTLQCRDTEGTLRRQGIILFSRCWDPWMCFSIFGFIHSVYRLFAFDGVERKVSADGVDCRDVEDFLGIENRCLSRETYRLAQLCQRKYFLW